MEDGRSGAIPHRGTLATLVPMGPEHWGPDSEEWVFHLNYDTNDTRAIDDAQVVADMKDALGLPQLDAKVHVVSRWSIHGHINVVTNLIEAGRGHSLGVIVLAKRRAPPGTVV